MNKYFRWRAQPGRQTCSAWTQHLTPTCPKASDGSKNTEREKMRRSGFKITFFDEFYMFRLAIAQIRDLVFGVVSYFFLCSGNTLCQVRRMTDEKL